MAKKKDKLENFIKGDLKGYCDFFEKNNLSELKIDSDDVQFTLKKETTQLQNPVVDPIIPIQVPNQVAKQKKEAPEEVKNNFKEIKSPIVGTFYQSLAPGEKPCVKVGDKINTSSVVCIVESMKVMNQIKSDFSGEVKDILVKDGDNVKVGQIIMLVK